MLPGLTVVMVKTRFPENVGMVARACVNMGAQDIVLVDPERWEIDKARPLATAKGEPLLERVKVVGTLSEAVADCTAVWGTTARTGGWRREILTPEKAGPEMAASLADGERVALLLGPEDRGLNNDEIEHCTRLLTIPTAPEASSLNVAQASLIVLYECHKASLAHPFRPGPGPESRRITQDENELLLATLRDMLLDIDFLRHDNPDYFMMPVRRFMGKAGLRRHEFDMLMGVCRQVRRVATLARDRNRPDSPAS
ncbi:RNA methyltransferase [Nitratidesulfovibrio vulgaris]|uniref:RNA methyltransferase, TrmH family n=2 Tax=Nitratidesulfovibrio vulgaris TaxID=881 RepID=Q727W7_NITV2|nr:RNA methyltransferase [Nitratidesulfovibrio vulgaris]GEB79659.1 rRNA methyltransferase [Desulfovibrio desulfuricans]HBW16206.1 rRNA methyltransferase [Desulfovibrio sp.]AAS97209.1 RNA methyltransferase, TrmH family [Nitratidesulfovibrio vulgaris str. Hildenborough]ABM27592.1 tRNA/rRNA methyltransferase (SpoU) [Nitratidesulfovibrio vulgaris DP4]ADP87671.1 tRNA/rRNA methyltransferase (SpoU) [Nitratidesulfovibrio vulgaris RCH1]